MLRGAGARRLRGNHECCLILTDEYQRHPNAGCAAIVHMHSAPDDYAHSDRESSDAETLADIDAHRCAIDGRWVATDPIGR